MVAAIPKKNRDQRAGPLLNRLERETYPLGDPDNRVLGLRKRREFGKNDVFRE